PGYFLLTYGLYAWPLGPALLAAGLALPGRMKMEPPLRFLFCWLVPWWLLCELVPTKLPHYMLPAYPALALALGWAAAGPAAPERPRWQRWLLGIATAQHAIVTLALAVIVIAAPIVLGQGATVAGLLAALILPVAGWLGWRHAGSARGMVAVVLAAALGYGVIFAAVAPALERMWLSPRIVAALARERPCADT